MRIHNLISRLLTTMLPLLGCVSIANAQIQVTEARIGCLDSPTANAGNLTGLVASACNGKDSCSYKAPTEAQYQSAGVRAHTKLLCSQAMEITYRCADGPAKFVNVPGDAWKQPPAELVCEPPPPAPGSVAEPITVTEARIGCLDSPTAKQGLLFLQSPDRGPVSERGSAGAHETALLPGDGDRLPMRSERQSSHHCARGRVEAASCGVEL